MLHLLDGEDVVDCLEAVDKNRDNCIDYKEFMDEFAEQGNNEDDEDDEEVDVGSLGRVGRVGRRRRRLFETRRKKECKKFRQWHRLGTMRFERFNCEDCGKIKVGTRKRGKRTNCKRLNGPNKCTLGGREKGGGVTVGDC
jgi:hypothetical protein